MSFLRTRLVMPTSSLLYFFLSLSLRGGLTQKRLFGFVLYWSGTSEPWRVSWTFVCNYDSLCSAGIKTASLFESCCEEKFDFYPLSTKIDFHFLCKKVLKEKRRVAFFSFFQTTTKSFFLPCPWNGRQKAEDSLIAPRLEKDPQKASLLLCCCLKKVASSFFNFFFSPS